MNAPEGKEKMLKIVIIGECASGKTTIASEIAALLESLNMNVTVKDADLNAGSHPPDIHEGCVEAMAGREVEITTVQTQRSRG